MSDEGDELKTEAEEDEIAFVEFDISVSPSDPPLELLCNQLKKGDIIIPFYQRRYVWKIEQASRLVESFLMGLPVPQIFLYVNAEDRLEVIDGQQRIKSVAYFLDGYFGEVDDKGRRQVFKLKGLSERSEYNGKTFAELAERDQRRLRNATLRAINIKQLKPSLRNDSVFHIFERLNTGGTQLKPQEIRNAVYRGAIVDRLSELNELASWRTILGLSKADKNQKDVELILRLFSLFNNWNEYEKPMLKYLNAQMDANRAFDSAKAKSFIVVFQRVVDQVARTFERPFRPRNVINSAVLEAVMVTLLENPDIEDMTLLAGYVRLLENPEFLKTITGGTTDTLMLKRRLTLAGQAIVHGNN
jgi:Protein of unknown function DUF262